MGFMVLLLHLLVALSSVAYTTYILVAPSRTRLHISSALVAATLASGVYLVISSHAPILQSCISGLFYIGFVSVGLISARRKLAGEEARGDR